MIRIDIAPPQPANQRDRRCSPISEAAMKSLKKIGIISTIILMGTFAYTLLGPKDSELNLLPVSFGVSAGLCGTTALAAGLIYNTLVR